MAEAQPKKRRSEEYMARRREIEKEQTKTRIYIGESIQRWRELRRQKGFQSDAQVAKLVVVNACTLEPSFSEAPVMS
uniref:Uncharacterized protein n=1 Tax=Sander lucioperca TaxID=283035 RepID=A0A8D0DAP9_SANLU